MMEFPDKCPSCNKTFDGEAYLLERARPDWDSDKPDRIDDSIMECSYCHTLFRLRWKLESLSELVESVQSDKESK
jgi:hypothetical protein